MTVSRTRGNPVLSFSSRKNNYRKNTDTGNSLSDDHPISQPTVGLLSQANKSANTGQRSNASRCLRLCHVGRELVSLGNFNLRAGGLEAC